MKSLLFSLVFAVFCICISKADVINMETQQLDHLIALEEQNQKHSNREKRQAINIDYEYAMYRIFNKTKPIFYVFNESFSNPTYRQIFRDAMDYINSYTCLNLTEGTALIQGQQNIQIVSGSGCSSTIGNVKLSGAQSTITLGPGCEQFYAMCHETLHSLGFHHTQSRHDRDNYIRILANSSSPYYAIYYGKVSESVNNNYGLPYDLGSIMHYRSTWPNGSMEPIDETKRYSIGATDTIVFSDFKMLNVLYSCQEKCPTGPECKNQGFRNPKNCNVCICPRGFHGNDCSTPQFTQDTNETCGGLLQAQTYLQTFSGSLNSYSNSSTQRELPTCYWHIKAPDGKAVRVKFISYGGSEFNAPCYISGLEVRIEEFESIGARVCRQNMIDPTLEYKAPLNFAIVAAFTKYQSVNFSFSYWFVDGPLTTTTTTTATTTTTLPITTEDPRPFTPLNCSGAMDLVFVIDASDTMTQERLEIVKSQLVAAIDQNGIKWDSHDNEAARVAIVLSTGLSPGEPTSPYRYNDFKGCPFYHKKCNPTVLDTSELKNSISDILWYGGQNDIALSMNLSLNGDFYGFPYIYYVFGEKIFGGEYDRPSVPNAMIVISGADTSNVNQISSDLKNSGVQVFSIGFEDLPISQLHAISGKPARSFSTTPNNLANTIKKICTGIFENPSTETLSPSTSSSATQITTPTTSTIKPTSTSTTTTQSPITTEMPRPFIPLNCSGAMDLIFVIDASDTMTKERFEIVKMQLANAVYENGIKWDKNDNGTSRIAFVLSTGLSPGEPTTPYRYLDFKGCPYYSHNCTPMVSSTRALIDTLYYHLPFDGGVNNIALCMNFSLNGNFNEFPEMYYIFGEKLFGGDGDRLNVPNAMIVISGADTSNVNQISSDLKNSGVQIFSIGFEDLPVSQLQAISGNPATAFSTTPENLANTIKKICIGVE